VRIDAHQHFWEFDPKKDHWITDQMSILRQDFMPKDLEPHLIGNQMDGCVAIQASQSATETNFLLGLAEENDLIKGVVGWIDLKSESLIDQLDKFSSNRKLKGFRHILQDEPEGFMLKKNFVGGVRILSKYDFSYDILTTEYQLDQVIEFISKLPNNRLVIDHISKPKIREGSFDTWAIKMKEISAFDNVYVKLSGLITEANRQTWTKDDIAPYIDFCMAQFGPERLMFGSDWPVCLLAGAYHEVLGLMQQCIQALSPSEQAQIMGSTATEFYQL